MSKLSIKKTFSRGPERTKFFREGEIFFGLQLCMCYKDTITVLPAQSRDNSGYAKDFQLSSPPLTTQFPSSRCTHSLSTSEDACQATRHTPSLIIHPFLHGDPSLLHTHAVPACSSAQPHTPIGPRTFSQPSLGLVGLKTPRTNGADEWREETMLAPSYTGNHSSHHSCERLVQYPLHTTHTECPLHVAFFSLQGKQHPPFEFWVAEPEDKYHQPMFTDAAWWNTQHFNNF